jgi:uncharacterized protein YndB with AHSA1/START domain
MVERREGLTMIVSQRTGPASGEVSFTTALNPEAVYDYLVDFERHPEWSGGLVRLEKTSEGPPGVGTTYKTTEALQEKSKKMQDATFCEITALERPCLIEWQARTSATGGPMAMRSRWAFVIEHAETGSRVTQRFALDPTNLSGRIFMRAFIAVADGVFGGVGASPKNIRKHAEKLRQILDGMKG